LSQKELFETTYHWIYPFLKKFYDLSGTLTPLAGEIDLNFKIETNQGEVFLLKLYDPNTDLDFLDFQEAILKYLNVESHKLPVPEIILNKEGHSTSVFKEDEFNIRKTRLLSWLDGRLYNDVNPQKENLRYSLGLFCGLLSNSLDNFDHPYAHREYPWDIAQGLWTQDHLDLFNSEERNILDYFLNQFSSIKQQYDLLRKAVVHNDANDYNCIVSEDLVDPQVVALIDFGDAIYTQVINDVAIACTYAIMGFEDPLEAAIPLLKGYHASYPLQEDELEVLYHCIAIRLVISVTKARINKLSDPDNPYLQISERPAWELLRKWIRINSEYAKYAFRDACGFSAHPERERFDQWANQRSFSLTALFPTLTKQEVYSLDLSVSSPWLGPALEFNNLDWFAYQIGQFQKENPTKILAGGYLEPRPLYTESSYDKIGNNGLESRCVHLGVDFWIPKKTPVHTLFDGEVVIAENDAGNKKYGGLVVLLHNEESFSFYSLYGHLSISQGANLKIGDRLNKGDLIGYIGDSDENGNWVPHLHFQLMLTLLDFKTDFPGVGYYSQKSIWESMCPNPNALFKIRELDQSQVPNKEDILKKRQAYLGKGMSLQYREPLHIVRGFGVYLIDQNGRKYLDTVNNVAHVGHEHPGVVQVGQRQMGVLNTNSRYIHPNITALADELMKTLPKELSVFHFVNSGSEANELALRMVKAATGSEEMFVSEVGYHGNTNGCIAISSYKFDGAGGKGAPENTHVFPMPDAFRGKYRGEKTASNYCDEIQLLLDNLHANGKKLGGFIIEPILSCGGQVELPVGFLENVYPLIKNSGGLCISDEVQTGCGRMGKTFWGFELHGVIPDIVTIGKPLGNGHPVAAVVCTEEVAKKFANGMEFFNTFGGNPVSCAIAAKVLQVVREEKLQQNAHEVGNYLKTELKLLAEKYSILGSIRGQGLFLGVELIDSDGNPTATQTSYLVDRMKDYGILTSIDGPDHNVIKIKPPLIFSKSNAQFLLQTLRRVLDENAMHF